ncbi:MULTISPECIES: hypothetical protein [Aneurinibacillus]|uniref:WXG100 protein secretion system (Wss), protein YukD n=1 Tax=Aneurinibacillus thermoaerophilus TaxID=143495 RepID=A0A1G8CPG7_ANETH|nr:MULTISPECIES: hypothetical protein [Aneurinibacillus]AMA71854.1 hypothetical protein ACH33_02705 [Aneurinibacillus sp. XH2]MED0677223.1 hypothetical protein [Aneurinibacillus thermoaerophilus]MED0737271.1 hypothetical protein [Aneurinibacillus thermoaerophilus]MED0757914.1 hypothetical protein [Aneurinibacillus thermoaerophilus]MED0761612.1 hypothetical protein [Aneurinibacillus thermoaerophilus]
MEEIIVTFIHHHQESDLRLPNQVESEKLVIALNEWLGYEYDWTQGIHDLEYSFDQKHWFRLEKQQSLERAGIWDGAFLRFSKEPASTLPTESAYEKMYPSNQETTTEADEVEQLDYVWKIIE